MNDTAITLPPELQYNIGKFCTLSSLASLAQVHTSYQREAERALYHKLSICTATSEEVKCLEMLSAHPQKASLVHSLTVEIPSLWSDKSGKAGVSFLGALGHMRALSDLRIMLPEAVRHYPEPINNALRSKHFQLHTLYCNDFLDISGIIDGHPELQLLGIYTSGGGTLKTLKRINVLDSLLTFPMVFGLERRSLLPLFNHLSIFPAFYSNRPTTCRAIADSLDRHVSRGITTDKATVSQVSIYIRDFSDMDLLRNTVEDMALWFPRVMRLNLSAKRPSQVQYPEFSGVLSFVTGLTALLFLPWDTPLDGSEVLSNDGQMAQAKAWAATCPDLLRITFLDGVTLTRDNHDSDWEENIALTSTYKMDSVPL